VIDLQGKKAFVTGASRGIGRAIAVAYAEAGADVALVARDADKLAEVAEAVSAAGRAALVLPCDVTDPDAVAATVAAAIEGLGHLDVVVNNAGGNSVSVPFVDLRTAGWEKVLRLNLQSTVDVCRAVGPHLLQRQSGAVVNVSSVAALSAVPFMAHYGAAKAAVLSLTKTLAAEWAWAGVRVNALVPGWIETDLTEFARESPDISSALIGRVPMQRWGRVDEMTGPAVFLASDAASFVTGQTLVADGGLTVS
jgi:NAD(P)-dependent dehydrogenase (short-subunit alcohol dehydrogenase family)